MKYSIDRQGESAYIQIYKALKEDISRGVYSGGQRLPSKRLLASELGVSVITVEHAYALLVDEALAVSRERSGYFAADGAAKTVPPAKKALLQDMSAGADMEDFPFSTLSKLMRRVLSEQGERILRPSPNFGCGELREAIREYLARSRGITADTEQIIIGSGAEYLYGLVRSLLSPGSFAVEDPCYEKIRRVYELGGDSPQRLEMGSDGIKSDALESCDAHALHVTPYRSFPSGITATAAKRREYAKWALEREAYIIEDDYDSELAVTTGQIDTIFSILPERTVYINTFSKTVAPSFRMGYMLLPYPLLERYKQILGFYSCTVPVYEQLILAELIKSGELERLINRRRKKLRSQIK